MSVLSVLTEEHDLLTRFVKKLRWDEPVRQETAKRMHGDLLAFFCALERHEEFEDMIFAGPAGPAVEPGRLKKELAAEHRRFSELRAEIVKALDAAQGKTLKPLKPRVDALTDHLTDYFRWEEERLWPCRRPSDDPAVEKAIEASARPRLDKLIDEVAACGVWLSDAPDSPDLPGQWR